MKLAVIGMLLYVVMVTHYKGNRQSVIGCLSKENDTMPLLPCVRIVCLMYYIKDRTADGEEFCNFIELCLLPQLLPFNGSNPRSVVVLDNASIHHIEHATSLTEEMGALVVFLPPYSPDLMPIEELFSKIKGFLRANDPYIQIANDSEIKDVILAAFACYTN